MTNTFTCSIEVPAPPEMVFDYFIDAELLVTWIGDYALLDAQPGGEFTLNIEGIPVRGQYLEVVAPERVVVSWVMRGPKQCHRTRPKCNSTSHPRLGVAPSSKSNTATCPPSISRHTGSAGPCSWTDYATRPAHSRPTSEPLCARAAAVVPMRSGGPLHSTGRGVTAVCPRVLPRLRFRVQRRTECRSRSRLGSG